MAEEDLLWGKSRHLFGGIEPSNMSSFSIISKTDNIKLLATLPKDTVVDGQTLCTVAGAVIRRTTEIEQLLYPYSHGGTNQFPNGSSTMTVNGITFTDNGDRTITVNGTATETARLFLFSQMQLTLPPGTYRVSSGAIGGTLTTYGMNFKWYNGTSYHGQVTDCGSGGTLNGSNNAGIEGVEVYITIMKGTTVNNLVFNPKIVTECGCPVDEFDGDFVADIKTSGTVIDSTADLSRTYYYAAFPYTTQGVYNRNKANVAKYSPTGPYYIYGYDLDTTNADPDARVTYPSDVNNELFEPAKMNFTGTTAEGTFSYGSWPSTPGEGFMPKPCMLNYDCTIKHYLDPYDYTKKLEDGTASDYNDTSVTNLSNAMMEWPKIYTKRTLVNGIYKFRCSPVKIDHTWECWCNYDKNNNEIDHFYTSIYKRPFIPSREATGSRTLRSLAYSSDESNQAFGFSTDYYMTLARRNRSDTNEWNIEVLSDHLLIQDLLIMMAKTTDLKSAYGDGWSETTDTNAGGLEQKGLFYGAPKFTGASTQTGRVKVFGMEDYWDSQCSRKIAGWINDNGVQKVKLTEGTKDGTTTGAYNVTGTGYLTIPDAYAGSGGYISDCRVASYGRIPIDYSGSKTTYECDYCSSGNQAVYAAIIGGILNGSENRGPFSVVLNKEQDYTSNTIAASISCKPYKS